MNTQIHSQVGDGKRSKILLLAIKILVIMQAGIKQTGYVQLKTSKHNMKSKLND